MFSLSDVDSRKRMLSCGDGPASFNVEVTQRGGHVVSADPIYVFSSEEIGQRIEETSGVVLELTRRNRDEFV